jgi:hypothetical protein
MPRRSLRLIVTSLLPSMAISTSPSAVARTQGTEIRGRYYPALRFALCGLQQIS